MTQELTPYDSQSPLEIAAPIADSFASQNRLHNYQRGLSEQTLRRQKADIGLFKQYLNIANIPTGDFFAEIEAWRGISWGIVEGFREWQLQEGYAMGSINVRLATIKKYAHLAFQGGLVSDEAMRLIQSVKGFYGIQARNIDTTRKKKRVGLKKERPTKVSRSHIDALVSILEKDTSYFGVRDYLLLCLLGRQGLRCSEVASLQIKDIHLTDGTFDIYRQKVHLTQHHRMHALTLLAMQRYLEKCQPPDKLFSGINRKTHKASDGLSTRAINDRIGYLGKLVGLEHLSPHDLRHYWTSDAFKEKTPIDVVMEAGGWKSYIMPLHYRGQNTIANEGIKQSQ